MFPNALSVKAVGKKKDQRDRTTSNPNIRKLPKLQVEGRPINSHEKKLVRFSKFLLI